MSAADSGSRKAVGWLLAILAGTVVSIFARKTSASSFGGKVPADTKGYSTQSWISLLTPLCQAADIPLPFATSSINEESGGNPCAIGKPGALGPDGNPLEMGILQWYNPDDLSIIKLTGNQLRAYCVGKREDVARLLTDDEMMQQAHAVVLKISQMRAYAGRYASLAGVTWRGDSVDLWRLVKLVHGLPGLVQAILAVTKKLGRAPSSWGEYRTTIMTNPGICDAATEHYRSDFGVIFDNAENATATMGDVS
jgi:hypothetical protein